MLPLPLALPLPLTLSVLVAGSAYAAEATDESQVIDINLGESVIRRESRPISRVLTSDPEVLDIRVLEPGQYQLLGLSVGTTDLWVWYRDDVDHPVHYKVVINNASVTEVRDRVSSAVSEEPPLVYAIKDRLVVEGDVPDLQTLERIAAIATLYDENFVNLMTVRGDQQVQLRVVFAEVNRSALRELGFSFLLAGSTYGGGLTSPVQTTSSNIEVYKPDSIQGGRWPQVNDWTVLAPSTESFYLTSFITSPVRAGTVLGVLETQSLARTLAQPTLVALSGQQATFLSGGEVPVPVGQSNGAISLEFKEYGIKLAFVPTVLGDQIIDMRAAVEVSEVDPSNSVQLVGIQIPGFATRKAESHLRMESGMTFAMAGLLSEQSGATKAKIPVLGDIPLIGALFRYVRHERTESELVIFVTPYLVRPMSAGEVPPPPGTTEDYNPNDFELFLLGSMTRPNSRTAEPTGPFGMQR